MNFPFSFLAPPVTGFDTNAQTYITALTSAGVTPTGPQQTAINNWFVNTKADGTYAKLIAAYLFIGGTAATHAINAINPGTFNITWNGTVSHSANGTTGNGSTGYGDTGINPSTNLTQNGAGISFYSRITPAGDGSEMGSTNVSAGAITNGIHLLTNFSSGYYTSAFGGTNENSGVSPGVGFYQTSRTVSTAQPLYFNGAVKDAGVFNSASSLPTATIHVLGLNPEGSTGTNYYSYCQCAFAGVDTGMTGAQMGTFYTRVQALQTALARNV